VEEVVAVEEEVVEVGKGEGREMEEEETASVS
jgi:hypothetical protein